MIHSTANLPPVPILNQIKVFSRYEIPFQKKLRTYLRSLYFSRILRQICYNLVMENVQSQNRPDRTFCPHNWQVNVRKTFALIGWFRWHIINMGGKQHAANGLSRRGPQNIKISVVFRKKWSKKGGFSWKVFGPIVQNKPSIWAYTRILHVSEESSCYVQANHQICQIKRLEKNGSHANSRALHAPPKIRN